MAEQIILDVDDRPAREAVRRANQELDNFEGKARKAADGAARVVDSAARTYGGLVNRVKGGISELSQEIGVRLETRFGQTRTAGQQVVDVIGQIPGAARLLQGAANPITALAAAFGFATTAAISLVSSEGAAAEATLNLASRLGTAVGETERLQASARIAGVELGSLEGAATAVGAQLDADGARADRMRKALQDLGIATFTANGAERERGKILLESISALSQVADSNERLRLSYDILGKASAKTLAPLIEDFRDLDTAARALGIGLDEGVTKRLAAADDEIGKLSEGWRELKKSLSEKIAPIVLPVVISIRTLLEGGSRETTTSNEGIKQIMARAEKEAAERLGLISNEGISGVIRGAESRVTSAVRSFLQNTPTKDLNAPDPKKLADDFKREQGRSLTGLNAAIEDIKDRRASLARALSSGELSAEAFARQKGDLQRLDRERGQLEAQVKAIQNAPAVQDRIRKLQNELRVSRVGSDPTAQAVIRARIEVEDAGRETGIGGATAAAEKATTELRTRFQELLKKTGAEAVQQIEIEKARRLKADADVFNRRLTLQSEVAELQNRIDEQRLESERALIDIERDRALRQVDLQSTRTVTTDPQQAAAQTASVASAKEAIEVSYFRRLEKLQLESIDRRLSAEIAALDVLAANADPSLRSDIQAKRLTLEQGSANARQQIEVETQARIDDVRDRSEIERARVITDAYQRTWDRVRDGFESTFDALTDSTRTWAQRGRAIVESFFLTPIKQFASRIFADIVVGGGTGGSSARASGGLLGSLFGSSGGGFGIPGLSGAPGGTGGFSGPVGGGSRLGGFGGLLGGGRNALDSLRNLGNIGFGPKGGDFGGEVAGSFRGVGGLGGAALLAGGGALAIDGLRRGGKLGLLETTGGGALIGYKFGGPIGAAIGASVGAVAGLIRLNIKTATEKATLRLREVYGVTVSKDIAQQVVEIGKSVGGLEIALYRPEVRDLVTYYGMATAQGNGSVTDVGRTPTLVQRGGVLYQQTSSVNGQSYGFSSILPSTSPFTPYASAPSGPTLFQIPADQVEQAIAGQVVNVMRRGGAEVSSALQRATSASQGRRQLAVNVLEPGTVA